MHNHFPWQPDPAPFGNARGLDHVSVDVKVQIAERFGATILRGELPDGYTARPPADGDRRYATLTISHDGLSVSGDHRDGRGYTRGYKSSDWPIDPDTVVFDLRTVPDKLIVTYAVRGPMCDPSLPPGTVSSLDVPDLMRDVADDYLRPYGGLDAVHPQEAA